MHTVEVRRAKRGLFKRNQFRVVLHFSTSEEFSHTETYSNHSYAVALAQGFAAKLGWEFVDATGIE